MVVGLTENGGIWRGGWVWLRWRMWCSSRSRGVAEEEDEDVAVLPHSMSPNAASTSAVLSSPPSPPSSSPSFSSSSSHSSASHSTSSHCSSSSS